jgi:hypothetical protein
LDGIQSVALAVGVREMMGAFSMVMGSTSLLEDGEEG